ncbi:helix-turn-helix transcriptional regulator [Flavobacterium hauense]
MSTNSIYPGILCDSIEFFTLPNGQFKAFNAGQIIPFYATPYPYLQLVRETIEADEPAKVILMQMHPDSEMMRVEQYCRCNFSGLDFVPDIKEGIMQKGEYWDCPKRDLCPGDGIICKPLTYNNKVINSLEIKIIQKSVSDKTNDVIAEELFLPLGTFHLLKKQLHDKLGVFTKQELTLIAVSLNLIQI